MRVHKNSQSPGSDQINDIKRGTYSTETYIFR